MLDFTEGYYNKGHKSFSIPTTVGQQRKYNFPK